MTVVDIGKVKNRTGGTVVVKWDDHSRQVFAGPWQVPGKAGTAREAIIKAEAYCATK